VHQYLVVANHTLGGQELLDAIRDRMSRGSAEFWVLVPATPTPHLVNDLNALSGAFPVELDVLPSPERATNALLTRSPTLTPNCTVFARSAPQPTAPWATPTR
jgi:hypothetical protein